MNSGLIIDASEGSLWDPTPPKQFMGFGYNPDLSSLGERLDILNFFSWMKKIKDVEQTKWFIYDASGYYIVNRTPERSILKLGQYPKAGQILEVLAAEQDKSKRKDIMENCDIRRLYLEKLIQISEIGADYIDSRDVFRVDERYQRALDAALCTVRKLEVDNPQLLSLIFPKNSNSASRLYLPLEIAEVIYLKDVFGVECKFGPETELWFDDAVLEAMRGATYQARRCVSGPRKPGYLSDRNVIWTCSPDNFVDTLLKYDTEYRTFVERYASPFKQQGEFLEDCVKRLRDELRVSI
ncbi:MAG: hypothetical protein HY512_00800 [Candidatus Aenigmarchaeota archaeon]|nr:hypothetical protein [Candidatus Aenigmarchaeota archaeon]